jgi:uncharacterized surface protein with fasciclin (FAS1) repeats
VGKTMMIPGSLTAMNGGKTTFSTVKKGAQGCGTRLARGTKREYTIFAPTDDAFGKFPAEVLMLM